MQPLLSNTCDLFSRIFEVFNGMEMEINVINNKSFTKFYLKIRVRGKESLVGCESFLESNSPDILFVCETNLEDSTTSDINLNRWEFLRLLLRQNVYF